MKLNDLLSFLPHLTQVDLATLRAAIDTLMVAPEREQVDETTPLYEAMTELIGVSLSYRDFINVQVYKSWKRFAPAVVLFIEQNFPKTAKSKVAKQAMMTFLIEALIDDLKARGVPVTLGTITVNINRLPALFDEVFPLYRKSGLANLVLEAMERGSG